MKPYDIYASYYEKEENVNLILETIHCINASGLGCWHNNQDALNECPIVVCFISDKYVRMKSDDVKSASAMSKVIFPVLIKKMKLSESPLGDIIDENKTKYYAAFKKDFDWRKVLIETLLQKLKRIVVDEKTVCPEVKLESLQTYPVFNQLNRVCIVEDFVLIGDWGKEIGVHVLNSKLEHKFTYNNNGKMKHVTGICLLDDNRIAIVSSVPRTRENSIFVLSYKVKSKHTIELTCLYEYNQIDAIDMAPRDLCGIGYSDITTCLYIVDRMNCSLLEFKHDLDVFSNDMICMEHVLYCNGQEKNEENKQEMSKNCIPPYFNRPVFTDICFDSNGTFYLTDHISKSEEYGNTCVHVFELRDDQVFWKRAYGTMELEKPIISIPFENNLLVLERSGTGSLKVYDNDGLLLNNFVFNETDHPRNMCIFGTKLIVTNLTNKLFVYHHITDDALNNQNTSLNLKLSPIEELHKLFNVFISYNQSSSKQHALQLYDILEENEYGCWMDIKVPKIEKEREILIGLKKCSTAVCFLTNNYLKSPICNTELETCLSTKKCVILAQMENIIENNVEYLKETVNKSAKNDTKMYFLDFRNKNTDPPTWADETMNIINQEFSRNSKLCKSEIMYMKTKIEFSSFKNLNRMQIIDGFIIVGDWETNVGIHILKSNFQFVRTYNNNNKFKKITGICKLYGSEIAFISSIPNTEDYSVFIMKSYVKNNNIEFIPSFEYNQKTNRKLIKRDLCGCDYNKSTSRLFIVDRMNCSILEFDTCLYLVSEVNIQETLPEHFNKPVLRDIRIKTNFIYLTDEFSATKNVGNDCVHILENHTFIWVKSIGLGLLKSPCYFSTNTNTELIGVLCRTNPGYLFYFNAAGYLLRKHKLDNSVFPKAVYETNDRIYVTNGKTSLDVYNCLNVINKDYMNLSMFNQFMHF